MAGGEEGRIRAVGVVGLPMPAYCLYNACHHPNGLYGAAPGARCAIAEALGVSRMSVWRALNAGAALILVEKPPRERPSARSQPYHRSAPDKGSCDMSQSVFSID